MKTVFITGVNGFIGQKLARRLLNEGYEVHGLVYSEKNPKVKRVIAHQGDLMSFDTIGRILAKGQFNFIIHLAARTEVEKSFYDPVDFSLVNYGGTVNLIEKAKEMKSLKLFVFASTMETYGWQPKNRWQPFEERTPQNPNAPYAVAKLACEYYLKYAYRAYEFPYTAFRQTNTYGRHDNNFFIVEQIITQMLENSDQIKLGYKEPYRNFLYIDDLIELYVKALKYPEKVKGQIFTLGPANAIRIDKLAGLIAEKLNWKGEILWNKKPKRVGEVYYLNSRSNKISKFLGWQPSTSLDDGIDKTIEIWRNQYDNNSKQ